MSDIPDSETESASIPSAQQPLPEELPPVEPPSARFIVQLFLIPGLIVFAVVALWLLFGKLTASPQDITMTLQDLRSANPHVSGRAQWNLTHMLIADAKLGDKGQQLSRNPLVADALATLLIEKLKKISKDKDHLAQQEFLSRALGWVDLPDNAFPALGQAMHIRPEPRSDNPKDQELRELQQEIRKSAIASIARIAGRAAERGETVNHPDLVEDLIDVSADVEPTVRQVAAFCLGLFPTQAANERLVGLLIDADEATQMNAAMALARQKSPEGFSVYKTVLQQAPKPVDPDSIPGKTARERDKNAEAKKFERQVALKNTLTAIADLTGQFDANQRAELVNLIEPISKAFEVPRIRSQAADVLQKLKSGG